MDKVGVADDELDYRANKVPRLCSCRMNVLQKDYKAHMKSGEHNTHMEKKP